MILAHTRASIPNYYYTSLQMRSSNWKNLIAALSLPRRGNSHFQNSFIFHLHKLHSFNKLIYCWKRMKLSMLLLTLTSRKKLDSYLSSNCLNIFLEKKIKSIVNENIYMVIYISGQVLFRYRCKEEESGRHEDPYLVSRVQMTLGIRSWTWRGNIDCEVEGRSYELQ